MRKNDMTDQTKLCTECLLEKPLLSFRKRDANKGTRKYYCIDCDNNQQRQRYIDNREKIKKQALDYYYNVVKKAKN